MSEKANETSNPALCAVIREQVEKIIEEKTVCTDSWGNEMEIRNIDDAADTIVVLFGQQLAAANQERETLRQQLAEAEVVALRARVKELELALEACFFALGRAGANTADGPGRAEWEQARESLKGGAQ